MIPKPGGKAGGGLAGKARAALAHKVTKAPKKAGKATQNTSGKVPAVKSKDAKAK